VAEEPEFRINLETGALTIRFRQQEIRGRILQSPTSMIARFDNAIPARLERQTIGELIEAIRILAGEDGFTLRT
jgi:hypothetical protein